MTDRHEKATKEVRHWVESCVLALNLCPFAHKPYREGRLRITSSAIEPLSLLWQRLREEFELLSQDPSVSNTLLVLVDQNLDFYTYLDLLEEAQNILEQEELEGIYQLASFHPRYEFAGESKKSRSHYTNRSPWPVFHILREDEITKVVDAYKHTESIPEANKKTLESLSDDQFALLFGSQIKQR